MEGARGDRKEPVERRRRELPLSGGDLFQGRGSFPSSTKTLMFPEVGTRTPFFPLSEESPSRVPGERGRSGQRVEKGTISEKR